MRFVGVDIFEACTRQVEREGVRVLVVHDAPRSDGLRGRSDGNVVGLHLGRPNRVRQEREDGSFDARYLPGELTIIPARCEVACWTDGPTSFAHVELGSVFVARVGADLVRSGGPIELPGVHRFSHPLARAMIEAVAGEVRRYGDAARLFVESASVVLLGQLLENAHERAASSRGLSPSDLRRVQDYLDAEMARNPGVHEVAAIAGMSPRHFARMFRRATGESVHRWFARRRVERARLLLANPQHSVLDVALEVGFANPSQFAAFFRKNTGQTPRELRLAQGVRRRRPPRP